MWYDRREMNKLVVVESPTKARTLGKFLGEEFKVVSSMGHVRDLPKSELGVDVEHDFQPHYLIAKGKKKTTTMLKKAAREADLLFLATDPDREGEAIAWHILEVTKAPKAQRVVFHEITEEAIAEAFAHPRELDLKLVDSQQARRILDRLVGYQLSPLLWRKVRAGLSAGRVQSVAVRLIVEREREREAFKPQEYWEIEARLQKGEQQTFTAKLVEKGGKKITLGGKEEADQVVAELKEADYEVVKVEKKERRRYPYPPFTTSTLQQAAVNVLGFSAARTMRVAQNLYEAGLITYHRTDSVTLSEKALKGIRGFIRKEYGSSYLPEIANRYKTRVRLAQEAHEAIRPTKVELRAESLEAGGDEKKLYELIWRQAVACQVVPAVYEQVNVEIKADGYLFKVVGSKLLFDGFTRVTGGAGEDKGLPEQKVGDKLSLVELLPSQHFTEPPPRYTEATLVKALEEEGIGRPSTYAPIISTIQGRGYVSKEGNQLRPEDVGIVVSDLLVAYFPKVVDLSFTARMEEELDEIAKGERQWVPVVAEFYEPFAKDLEKAQQNIDKSSVTTLEETAESCPECGKPLVVKLGKYGRFYSCSGFPECKFTKPFIETIGMKCPGCSEGEVIVRRTRRGKIFYGCSRYPKCQWASWRKPEKEGEEDEKEPPQG